MTNTAQIKFNKSYNSELTVIEKLFNKLLKNRKPKSLYEPCEYILQAGGKRLRPILVLFSAKTINPNNYKYYNAALAVELLHNFTLAHDDIMDNSDLRRGRPTLHKKYDQNTAILAGDNLIAIAYESLLKDCGNNSKEIISTFNHGIIEVCEGQSLDKEFESRQKVSIAEYLEMIYKKTAALAEMCCSVGGQLNKANKQQVRALAAFGKNLGMAFQINDDLLDITADNSKFGKPIGGDLVEGKKTFLFLRALEKSKGKDRILLESVITNKGAKRSEIEMFKELYEKLGVITDARNEIIKYTKRALKNLTKLPNNDGKEFLKYLAISLTDRNK